MIKSVNYEELRNLYNVCLSQEYIDAIFWGDQNIFSYIRQLYFLKDKENINIEEVKKLLDVIEQYVNSYRESDDKQIRQVKSAIKQVIEFISNSNNFDDTEIEKDKYQNYILKPIYSSFLSDQVFIDLFNTIYNLNSTIYKPNLDLETIINNLDLPVTSKNEDFEDIQKYIFNKVYEEYKYNLCVEPETANSYDIKLFMFINMCNVLINYYELLDIIATKENINDLIKLRNVYARLSDFLNYLKVYINYNLNSSNADFDTSNKTERMTKYAINFIENFQIDNLKLFNSENALFFVSKNDIVNSILKHVIKCVEQYFKFIDLMFIHTPNTQEIINMLDNINLSDSINKEVRQISIQFIKYFIKENQLDIKNNLNITDFKQKIHKCIDSQQLEKQLKDFIIKYLNLEIPNEQTIKSMLKTIEESPNLDIAAHKIDIVYDMYEILLPLKELPKYKQTNDIKGFLNYINTIYQSQTNNLFSYVLSKYNLFSYVLNKYGFDLNKFYPPIDYIKQHFDNLKNENDKNIQDIIKAYITKTTTLLNSVIASINYPLSMLSFDSLLKYQKIIGDESVLTPEKINQLRSKIIQVLDFIKMHNLDISKHISEENVENIVTNVFNNGFADKDTIKKITNNIINVMKLYQQINPYKNQNVKNVFDGITKNKQKNNLLEVK